MDGFRQPTIHAIGKGQTILVQAGTGAGKTVRVPLSALQVIKRRGFNPAQRRANVSSPTRRMAEKSRENLLQRNQNESLEEHDVGFIHTRDSKYPDASIVFITDQVLVNRLLTG